MSNTLNKIAVGLAAVALIVGVVSYNKTPSVVKGINGAQGPIGLTGPQGPQGERGPVGPQGPRGATGASAPSSTLGAVTGPDLYAPYWGVNGVKTWFNRVGLNTGTTTICAMQLPAATTSLVMAGLRETTSTTTASIVDIAVAATPYATTSLILGTQSIAANAQATIIASSSAPLAPNQWIVIKQNGGPGFAVSPVGTCSLVTREI